MKEEWEIQEQLHLSRMRAVAIYANMIRVGVSTSFKVDFVVDYLVRKSLI